MPVLATDSSTQLSSSAIYRSASPIFDVPEFPPLRRVKPLPKRRRSSLDSLPPLPPVLPPTPGPDASADELIAHAEALSAHMTLQAYYLPTLAALDGVPPIDRDRREDNDRDADGDYFDHLQQPGNAKKRKVPAHLSGGGAAQAGAEEPPDGLDGADEELAERKHGDAPGVGRQDHDADVGVAAPSAVAGRGRMLPATLVGLQHKEMLRHRKRQLAAVLGALSHGDTLALDQALSAHYPILNNASNTSRSRARYARRRRPRLPVRTQRAAAAFPGGEFSFVCHSATSDRLIATREEVAVLHARFEAELARQAAKASEAAKQAAAAAGVTGAPSKRSDRAPQKARKAPTPAQDTDALLTPAAGAAKASSRGKKKKRSALANASNPHHLRNYVPSRFPNQGQMNSAQAVAATQNLLSPHPLGFLSAEIAPRRGKQERGLAAAAQLVNPADEWICPQCEYKLFYGDEQAYRLALRNRKKILKRRRRARERAAAAASGAGTGTAGLDHGGHDGDTEVEYGSEAEEVGGSGGTKAVRRRGERGKDGDRGEGNVGR